MLAPWIKTEKFRHLLSEWSEAADVDLIRLGTTAEAEEIRDTATVQPLIVATALLAYLHIRGRDAVPEAMVTAGHSVGEIAALAIAGVIDFTTAVRLGATRGRAMAQACAREKTGMTAILGGKEEDVLQRLDELDLVVANRNARGQIVTAGTLNNLEKLAENPPARSRLRPLAVAGAFHTQYMLPAQGEVAQAIAELSPSDPQVLLLSNSDGQPVTTGEDALQKVAAQITRPVRWDLCLSWMQKTGITSFVELPPSAALVGIAKRELPGAQRLAIKEPKDLDQIPLISAPEPLVR